jgi:transcriptional regulator with XRE-family HTH domain
MKIEPQDEFLKKLGARIRELRLRKGMRQEDFDDETELGITARGFQEIEYGHKDVRIYTLYKIAKCLGVDLSELLAP